MTSEPTLTHDIEQWIQEHSHGDLYHKLEQQQELVTATIGLLTCLEARVTSWSNEHTDLRSDVRETELKVCELIERVASLEERDRRQVEWNIKTNERVARLEADVQLLLGALEAEEVGTEPRGPHD